MNCGKGDVGTEGNKWTVGTEKHENINCGNCRDNVGIERNKWTIGHLDEKIC